MVSPDQDGRSKEDSVKPMIIVPDMLEGSFQSIQGISIEDIDKPAGLLDKSAPYARVLSSEVGQLADSVIAHINRKEPLVEAMGKSLGQLDTFCNWVKFLQGQSETISLPSDSQGILSRVELLHDMHAAMKDHGGSVPALLGPMLYEDLEYLKASLKTYADALGAPEIGKKQDPALRIQGQTLGLFLNQAEEHLEDLRDAFASFLQVKETDQTYASRMQDLLEHFPDPQGFLIDVLKVIADSSPETEREGLKSLQQRLGSFFLAADVASESGFSTEAKLLSMRRMRLLIPVLDKAIAYVQFKQKEINLQGNPFGDLKDLMQ